MFFIPFALILSAFATKPGKWSFEQVDVNAPGSPNKTTLPLPIVSLNLLFLGSPSTSWKISVSGSWSFILTLQVI